jgi:uncharacterized protein YbcI
MALEDRLHLLQHRAQPLEERVLRLHPQGARTAAPAAQAFCRDNVVVALMQDSMTRGERSLAEDGRQETILDLRRQFRLTMRADLVRAVEELTGRRVVGFMSDSIVSPDLTAELFVLDHPLEAP